MDILKQILNKIQPLTEEEWTFFLSITQTKTLEKGDFFLEQGKICQSSAFILDGTIRHFMYDTSGNERIIQFSQKLDFVSDCDSYLAQKPTLYTIQAITKADIIVFKNMDLQNMSSRFPVFDKIGREVTHKILANYREHLALLMSSPEERYTFMLDNKPELLQKISVTHLAQFLGLTRETVSRLRGKAIKTSIV
jgi:CRP-like cAMP-binding protein